MKNKQIKRRKQRNQKILNIIGTIAFCILTYIMLENIIAYPEQYQPTARYHLKLRLDEGNEQAIAYYKENYTDRGVYLYGEK